MVAGMGSLLGLCPPPDEWIIASLLESFHVLPSQVKATDWQFLATYRGMKWLTRWYEIWHRVSAGEGSMPSDVVDILLDLVSKAEETWRTND